MDDRRHDWDGQTRNCKACHVPRHMVEDGFVAEACVVPPVCTCHPQLVADVRRNGTCIRGACPHRHDTVADSDGDDGA